MKIGGNAGHRRWPAFPDHLSSGAAALGVALYVIFSLIEGRVTGWAVRSHATRLPVAASADLPPNRPLLANHPLEPGTYQRQIGQAGRQ